MKKAMISALLLLLFVSPAASQSVWGPIATRVLKSIMPIEGPQGSCTGFMINTEKHYVLTAGHCDQSGPGVTILADKTPATLIYKDTKTDLLVFEAKQVDRPALKLAANSPKVGDAAASYGYGYGLRSPMFRVTHIAAIAAKIPEVAPATGPFIMTDTDFIPGQSGGPVVDINGDVVMIVQMSAQGFGLGIGAEEIRDRVGKYFEVTK